MKNLKARTFVLLLFLVSPSLAFAETLARFFPFTNQVMVTVYRNRLGGSDQDARLLFEAMNVPVQDSMLGPGKSLEDSTKSLSWVCGDKGKDGFQCTFMFKKSPVTRLRTNPIEVSYKITGQEARFISDRIHFNKPSGTFEFVNEEGSLKVLISPDETEVQYKE